MMPENNEVKGNLVFKEITKEREKQDKQWGGQVHDDTHNPSDWLVYMMKFMGRAAQYPFDAGIYRDCMIKIAALAVAAVESLDRFRGNRNVKPERIKNMPEIFFKVPALYI